MGLKQPLHHKIPTIRSTRNTSEATAAPTIMPIEVPPTLKSIAISWEIKSRDNNNDNKKVSFGV